MPKKIIWTGMLLGLIAAPAHAQIPVTDVFALAQLIKTAYQVQQIIRLSREELQTVQRLSRGYGGTFAPYRLPSLPQLGHDVGRYPYAAALLEGLNSGDTYGDRYRQVVTPVRPPAGAFDGLTPEARREREVAYAAIEIADSIAVMGVHESAQARGYAGLITQVIERLQRDTTAVGSEYHQLTAVADKIALAALIKASQDQNSNQVESAILEQQLARNLRLRREAVELVNMSLTRMQVGK